MGNGASREGLRWGPKWSFNKPNSPNEMSFAKPCFDALFVVPPRTIAQLLFSILQLAGQLYRSIWKVTLKFDN
jgi:hypothetical protein